MKKRLTNPETSRSTCFLVLRFAGAASDWGSASPSCTGGFRPGKRMPKILFTPLQAVSMPVPRLRTLVEWLRWLIPAQPFETGRFCPGRSTADRRNCVILRSLIQLSRCGTFGLQRTRVCKNGSSPMEELNRASRWERIADRISRQTRDGESQSR